jgi:hypothetical protein
MQNEPTAENSVASAGPATGSDARAAQDPDPAEMERLQEIDRRLARIRRDVADDDEEDAYDS